MRYTLCFWVTGSRVALGGEDYDSASDALMALSIIQAEYEAHEVIIWDNLTDERVDVLALG